MKKRKKRSTKPRIDKRKQHGKADPVRVQVAIKVARIPGVKVTKALLNSALHRFVETGKQPKGMKIEAIRWLNPVRKNKPLARWKSSDDADQSMAGARRTLRRLLRRLRFEFPGVREN